MTHDGPQNSNTARYHSKGKEEGEIIFGSPFMYKLLKEDGGKRIFANIHGHAHDGSA